MQTRTLRSIDELIRCREAWDELLEGSDVSFPTLRAEVLTLWLQHFGHEKAFCAVVVEEDGQFLAALPMLRETKLGVLPVLSLARNEWADTADLLMSRTCDRPAVAAELVREISGLRECLFWADDVRFQSPAWESLRQAATESGFQTNQELKHYVGLVETDDDWEAYLKRLSSGHRKGMRKADRTANSRGQLEFTSLRRLQGTQIRAALEEGFEIENRSWKSANGTSVMAIPGMLDFYIQSAALLAEVSELEILNLRLDGQLIAFEMGYHARGTYYSAKVGYDSDFAKLSPGQLLMFHQIQSYCGSRIISGSTR